MSRILVVDDKEMMRDSVATTLSRKSHQVVSASGAKDALDKLTSRSFDLVITDLQMPEMDGIALLDEIRKIDEQMPVIFMTAYGTVETAVAAMKRGAYDYITKPFSGDVLLVAAERALKHAELLKENQILKAAGTPGASAAASNRGLSRAMIGSGPLMVQLKERLARIADSHGTVLINGESGAGKEVAARAIHEQSPRASGPFLALNCAALSTSLLESELFGHEKGAFTGADKLRKGRFELADGGTLLLDEISEIAPEIQAKLLRVLQERAFERVGSSASRTVDVRVIATTNRDLPAEVERGRFRQDLYFRLNVLPLTMPSLRDHREDIPELAAHFLGEVAQREGKPAKRIEDRALELMQQYAWPGNVRELQNICERAAVLTHGETIGASLIEPWLCSAQAVHPARPLASSMIELNGHASERADSLNGSSNGSSVPLIVCDGHLTLEEIERETIVATLQHNQGHRQRSAEALGIGVRTLGLKLKKWKEQRLVAETL
ncbi:MAG TPA: sigma-54 dependent transcriptional regulator [Phycisphaerales bacterium]|nr:sigma-54 dependent transcriptional regulator [Phycisphaerales bacterium]